MSEVSDATANHIRGVANNLAVARVRFSREYQIAYAKQGNGFLAHQIAIEKTGDEITRLEAELKIAEAAL